MLTFLSQILDANACMNIGKIFCDYDYNCKGWIEYDEFEETIKANKENFT